MRPAAVVMLAACGGTSPASPDALVLPPTIDYELFVSPDGSRHLPLTIWIDGTQTSELHETYDRSQVGTTFQHTVELHYQDTVLTRREVFGTLSPCRDGDTGLLSIETSLGELDSGDLRPGGETITGVSWACVGDGFGIAACWAGTANRCAPVVELDTPLFTRLATVPAGTKQHGDACTFTPDANGAYDDCAYNLFCYQGTCHTLCLDGLDVAPGFDLHIDGYPAEVRLCD